MLDEVALRKRERGYKKWDTEKKIIRALVEDLYRRDGLSVLRHKKEIEEDIRFGQKILSIARRKLRKEGVHHEIG